MDENVQSLAIEHEPRHEVLELRRLEDDVELRDGVRPSRLVGEHAGLADERRRDRVAQPFGERPRGGIEIDVRVVALALDHCVSSCEGQRARAVPGSTCSVYPGRRRYCRVGARSASQFFGSTTFLLVAKPCLKFWR